MRSLTLQEVSRLLDVSRPTLLNWLDNGKLTGQRVGAYDGIRENGKQPWLIDPVQVEAIRQERINEYREKIDNISLSVYEYLGEAETTS